MGVFVLQLILGIAASYTVAYSLGASFQAFEDAVRNPNASPEEVFRLYREFQTLKSYTGNPSVSVHESIQAFYLIPSILLDVLPKAKLMVYSLLISLYMAGFTTVIVLIEMGAQMTAEVVQTNRRNALATVSVLSLAISLPCGTRHYLRYSSSSRSVSWESWLLSRHIPPSRASNPMKSS